MAAVVVEEAAAGEEESAAADSPEVAAVSPEAAPALAAALLQALAAGALSDQDMSEEATTDAALSALPAGAT